MIATPGRVEDCKRALCRTLAQRKLFYTEQRRCCLCAEGAAAWTAVPAGERVSKGEAGIGEEFGAVLGDMHVVFEAEAKLAARR